MQKLQTQLQTSIYKAVFHVHNASTNTRGTVLTTCMHPVYAMSSVPMISAWKFKARLLFLTITTMPEVVTAGESEMMKASGCVLNES